MRLSFRAGARAARIRAGKTSLLAASAAFIAAVAPGTASAASPRQFIYFLPRTLIDVEVAQRLLACPDPGKAPDIATTITVTSRIAADPNGKVALDAGANLFAKRTVKLELTPAGTLQSFNSETEGQGGPILTSIAKAAIFAASVALDARAPSNSLTCKRATLDKFDLLKAVGADIRTIEARVVAGTADAADLAMLELRRTQRTTARASLTLTTEVKNVVVSYDPEVAHKPGDTPRQAGFVSNAANSNGSPEKVTGFLTAPEYSDWFVEATPTTLTLAGQYGFIFEIMPDKGMFDALKTDVKLPTTATPDVIYRRPVPASITVTPCADAKELNCKLDGSPAGKDASSGAMVNLTQLSGLFTIRAGKGGLFGSRQASIKFDAGGAPIALEYGSGSGSSDVAGLVDTATAGATSLRDNEINSLNRQIAIEEARQKLAKLRAGTADDE